MSKRTREEEAPTDGTAPAATASSVPRELPKKRFYRQRAHANPFSDHELVYPACPEEMDWTPHYPDVTSDTPKQDIVKFLDVGCGFGGLLMDLAPLYPHTHMLGMEIRMQVTQYVADKILALRDIADHHDQKTQQGQEAVVEAPAADAGKPTAVTAEASKASSHHYHNVSVVRANAMKFLPNFIPKSSLEKIFFLFPDPHFKARKHKARIITPTLLAEYAYVLAPKARLYIATDVKDLFDWMEMHLDACPLFEALSKEEHDKDEVKNYVRMSTEEGKKVERNHGDKWLKIYERIA